MNGGPGAEPETRNVGMGRGIPWPLPCRQLGEGTYGHRLHKTEALLKNQSRPQDPCVA